ncbi:MAG: hypothetical protein Ct9H300mP2_2310 [Candidatus Neomarinimicrobiota bacterium]|nr:MAG: hypothetical protein Ct9H300mP2_2310 [Candidatus Neomarinimicrobiota bacterium]
MGFLFQIHCRSNFFCLQEFNGPTPAEEFEDGIDFVPTEKYILFGHHFTSIAGLPQSLVPDRSLLGMVACFSSGSFFGAIFMGAFP